MDSPLRLITTEATPAAALARVVEALLVVASQPLPAEELAAAAEVDVSQVMEALEILGERYSEETSGIVLEHVAAAGRFAHRRPRRRPVPVCSRNPPRRACPRLRSRRWRSSRTSGR